MLNLLADHKRCWQWRTEVEISLRKWDLDAILAKFPHNGTIQIRTYHGVPLGVINPCP